MRIQEEPQEPQHRSLPCAVLAYQEIHVSNGYVCVAESSEIVDEQMELHILSRFVVWRSPIPSRVPLKTFAAQLGRLLSSALVGD
jgi:hypothetical protein